MTYRANHYYSFDELTAYIQDLVARFPEQIRIESAGISPEGRDI